MKDDGGFTLPELLVAIVISAIVIAAITAALFSSLKANDKTGQRLAEAALKALGRVAPK